MTEKEQPNRENFGSKLGVIAAAAGSAVGLGNIWRFPYVAGENGGGAFLLVYIGFVILIGVPVMLSEFVIGRRSQRDPVGAFKTLAPKTAWPLVGFIGITAAFTILAFYTTVAGWTLEYLYLSFINGFGKAEKAELSTQFSSFVSDGLRPVFWQMIFMAMTAFIILKGVKNGIEKYTKIMMPMLLIILLFLVVRSVTLPNSAEGLKFLFQPDFSKIGAQAILQALGQAFFSLSIGMGTLITYGSYINKKDILSNTAISVSLIDTIVAILAGIAIFPAVFSFGIAPEAGPSLVFITLPMIFSQMSGGQFFEIIFFILLAIAALTSTISVLEVVVAYLAEELKMNRKKATIIAAGSISVLGILCTLSQGPLPELKIAGLSLFDVLDKSSANIFLPLGGFFIVVFVGWVMQKQQVFDEITNNNSLAGRFRHIYFWIIRFIAPIAIALVFLNGLGLFGAGNAS